MMAILLDRHLQSVANYLILSLALADLLVAVLVMPLGAVYEVRKKEHIVNFVKFSKNFQCRQSMFWTFLELSNKQ